jgi:hypothetical protein
LSAAIVAICLRNSALRICFGKFFDRLRAFRRALSKPSLSFFCCACRIKLPLRPKEKPFGFSVPALELSFDGGEPLSHIGVRRRAMGQSVNGFEEPFEDLGDLDDGL